MKKLLFLITAGTMISCTSVKQASRPYNIDELCTTRRYIGNFVDYYQTGPGVFGSISLVWIRTTLFNYGKISVYGTQCDFSEGERIYLKRASSVPGPFGNWEYQVENDSSVVYRVSNYRYENNTFVQAYN